MTIQKMKTPRNSAVTDDTIVYKKTRQQVPLCKEEVQFWAELTSLSVPPVDIKATDKPIKRSIEAAKEDR